MESPEPSPRQRSADEWMPRVYDELRQIASSYLGRERADHTLQPTALVHEAWMKLADQHEAKVSDQGHFRAVASQAMRRILVDHARGKGADKRDGGERVTLAGLGPVTLSGAGAGQAAVDVLALDAALDKLAAVNQRQAKVVELRFFGGLSVEQVAETLEVSPRTINGDWRFAKAWLAREVSA